MNRVDHLGEAEFRLAEANEIIGKDPNGAGEFIWGAMVHAISAADPRHGTPAQDGYGNPHPAPHNRPAFQDAAGRVQHPQITPAQTSRCLDVGQRKLHNHFYHLNRLPLEQAQDIAEGLQLADELIQISRAKLRTARRRP